MIVKSVEDLIGTDRDVRGKAFASRRFLLAEDGVGFTLTETTIKTGTEQIMWYKHHVEANYVIEGEGEVENIATGEVFPLKPGSVYDRSLAPDTAIIARARYHIHRWQLLLAGAHAVVDEEDEVGRRIASEVRRKLRTLGDKDNH